MAVIAYLFLARKHPFNVKTGSDHKSEILYKEPDLGLLKPFSQLATDFIKKGLIKNRDKRPTAKDLLSHPWLSTIKQSSRSKPENKSIKGVKRQLTEESLRVTTQAANDSSHYS